MPLRLMFWNSALAPVRGNGKRTAAEVATVVDAAFSDGAALVALCEVDELTLPEVRGRLQTPGIRRMALAESTKASRWDIGVLYVSSVVAIRKKGASLGRNAGTEIRAAQRLRVTNKLDQSSFYL